MYFVNLYSLIEVLHLHVNVIIDKVRFMSAILLYVSSVSQIHIFSITPLLPLLH